MLPAVQPAMRSAVRVSAFLRLTKALGTTQIPRFIAHQIMAALFTRSGPIADILAPRSFRDGLFQRLVCRDVSPIHFEKQLSIGRYSLVDAFKL